MIQNGRLEFEFWSGLDSTVLKTGAADTTMRPIALHKLEPIGARRFEETGGKNGVVQHMPKHLESVSIHTVELTSRQYKRFPSATCFIMRGSVIGHASHGITTEA